MNFLLLGLPLFAAGVLTFGTPTLCSPTTADTTAFTAPQGGGQQGGQGNPNCGLHSLRGHHGFTYDGSIVGLGPIASSGPIFFDGNGNLSASYSTAVNGITFRGSFVGTYTMNTNGSGSVTLTLPLLGLQAHGDFVLIDDGKGTFFSCTDAGFSISGSTRRR